MKESEAPTLRQFKIPVVLVVGASEGLIAAVSEAALSAQVLVAECSPQDAANTATQMRPLVLVFSSDVYRKDSESFDALARDVRAKVLHLNDSDLADMDLTQELTRLMEEAQEQRPSWTEDLR